MAEIHPGSGYGLRYSAKIMHRATHDYSQMHYQATSRLPESAPSVDIDRNGEYALLALNQEWLFQRAMRTYAYFGKISCFDEDVNKSFTATQQLVGSILNQKDRFGIENLRTENFYGKAILCALEALDLSDNKEHQWRVKTDSEGEATLPIPMPLITQTLLLR